MESLSYYLEARGSAFSEDIEFPVELHARSKNYVKDWDNKVLSDFCKTMPSFDREIVDNMEVSETNFSNTMGKLDLGNPGLRASTDKFTVDSTNVIASTSMANIDPLLWEGFTSKFSVDAAESYYCQKESTIDPNLDRWTASRKKDHLRHPEENLVSPLVEDVLPAKRIRSREADSLPYSEENSVPSLVEDSSPAKRARTTNLLSQFPVCQVHGCHKDLSSSKDYHKRHRVCDVHSKTAKVIINGIEKRFCQQCSRFHLLTEFDDDKRSCRKRLAGHNERRRKPQMGAHLEAFPAGFFYQERFEKDNHSRHIKFVEVPSDKSQSVVALNGRFCHVSSADQHIIYNQQPSKTCTDTAVAVELSVLRDSSSALSLLSAQSQNTSTGSAGISMALPQVNGIDVLAYKGTDQNSVNNLEMGTLKSFTSNGYSPGKIDDEGMARAYDGGVPLSFKVQREGTFQVSDYRHANCSPPFEVGTLDLLQLSLHLQRVEEQRDSLQVKQENEIFCSSSTL